jgi:hypothetical protein
MALLGIYLVACGLLALAGAAKAARPGDTARALWELASAARSGSRVRLTGLVWVVRVLAAIEGALGVAGLVYPHRPIAVVVTFSYLAFAVFVLYARARGGSLATCGCFGSPDTPPTVLHALVDVALASGALGLVVASPAGTIVGVLEGQAFDGWPLVAASAVTGVLAFAVMSPLARLAALRHLDPARGGR